MLTRSQLVLRTAARGTVTVLFAVLAGCSMMPGGADTTGISASLSAAAEVPPNTSAATGSLQGSYNKSSKVLSWKLVYSGLSGPATMAHFHGPAMAGQNAGVVVPFASAADPIKGEATLTDAQAADLLAGRWYVNLHTRAHPGGEIRAQVAPR